jgi:hypothetical protein
MVAFCYTHPVIHIIKTSKEQQDSGTMVKKKKK